MSVQFMRHHQRPSIKANAFKRDISSVAFKGLILYGMVMFQNVGLWAVLMLTQHELFVVEFSIFSFQCNGVWCSIVINCELVEIRNTRIIPCTTARAAEWLVRKYFTALSACVMLSTSHFENRIVSCEPMNYEKSCTVSDKVSAFTKHFDLRAFH